MNLNDAIELCKKIEAIAPNFGAHVALTGGCLYKEGERKDCDLIIYRIRQVTEIDIDNMFVEFASIGLEVYGGFGWCFKAEYNGNSIDLLFPEEVGGTYEQ